VCEEITDRQRSGSLGHTGGELTDSLPLTPVQTPAASAARRSLAPLVLRKLLIAAIFQAAIVERSTLCSNFQSQRPLVYAHRDFPLPPRRQQTQGTMGGKLRFVSTTNTTPHQTSV
jgi:hypothetical protein